MKKTLLFAITILGVGLFSSQVLDQINFENFSVGTIVGQGGYQNYNGTSSDFQVFSSTDKDLKIIGSNASSSKFLWKDGLDALWTSRDAGKNIIQIEYDFYTGGTSSSENAMGIELYDADYNYLAGLSMIQNTKKFYGIYTVDGGASLFNLGSSTVVLPANKWVRVGFAYNTTNGEVSVKGPNIDGVIVGDVSGEPFEYDFAVQLFSDTNMSSSENLFDNVVVSAVSTANLLAVDEFNKKVSVDVYPNPASDYININTKEKIKSVYLYNASGIRVGKYSDSKSIDIKSLPKGTYLVNINTEKGNITKKIIKK